MPPSYWCGLSIYRKLQPLNFSHSIVIILDHQKKCLLMWLTKPGGLDQSLISLNPRWATSNMRRERWRRWAAILRKKTQLIRAHDSTVRPRTNRPTRWREGRRKPGTQAVLQELGRQQKRAKWLGRGVRRRLCWTSFLDALTRLKTGPQENTLTCLIDEILDKIEL